MYRFYTYEVYDSLGRGIRVEISVCVRRKVREWFHDPSGNSMDVDAK